MTELTITIKGTETTHKRKFLLYDTYTLTHNDPLIQGCLNEAMADLKEKPEDCKITIRARMDLE